MKSRVRSLTKEYPNTTFFVSSCLIAAMVVSIWVIQSWEYLPEWTPVPGPLLMNFVSCLRPFFLLACGLPTALAFLTNAIVNFRLLINRTLATNHVEGYIFFMGLAVLATSTLPLFYKDQIEEGLRHYAISRYNVVIDAIEEYRADNGYYPASLDALIPLYLPATPGMYMKFGEELTYYPDASTAMKGYVGHGPFIFELTGKYAGIHGQTLKYCPIWDVTCNVFRGRIDDKWIWTYSSVL